MDAKEREKIQAGVLLEKALRPVCFVKDIDKIKHGRQYYVRDIITQRLEIMNTIENENGIVRWTDKIELSNGYDIQIVESINTELASSVDMTKTTFKIIKVSLKPIKSSTIFLTKQDEYVGHVSVNIYENNTADLSMFNLRTVKLPEELERLKQIILDTRSDVALKVDEKYQGLGKGKELMVIILNYLVTQNVKDVTVSSISNDISMSTYLKTGANRTGEKTAIYKNIKELV